MDDAALLADTLERVVARIGDPAPRVFARLFAESPDLQALFVNDGSGAVRGEMFLRAVECLQGAAGAHGYGRHLVAAEHQTHLGYGVPTERFHRFFALVVEVFREALGPAWTQDIDAAWGRAVAQLQRATA